MIAFVFWLVLLLVTCLLARFFVCFLACLLVLAFLHIFLFACVLAFSFACLLSSSLQLRAEVTFLVARVKRKKAVSQGSFLPSVFLPAGRMVTINIIKLVAFFDQSINQSINQSIKKRLLCAATNHRETMLSSAPITMRCRLTKFGSRQPTVFPHFLIYFVLLRFLI